MKLRIAAFKPFACIAAVIYIFVLAYGLIGFASAESGEYGEYGSKEKAERVKEIISSQLSEEEREMLGDESLYYGEPYAWFGDDFDIADYTLIRVLNYSWDDCGKPLEELAKKDFKVYSDYLAWGPRMLMLTKGFSEKREKEFPSITLHDFRKTLTVVEDLKCGNFAEDLNAVDNIYIGCSDTDLMFDGFYVFLQGKETCVYYYEPKCERVRFEYDDFVEKYSDAWEQYDDYGLAQWSGSYFSLGDFLRGKWDYLIEDEVPLAAWLAPLLAGLALIAVVVTVIVVKKKKNKS